MPQQERKKIIITKYLPVADIGQNECELYKQVINSTLLQSNIYKRVYLIKKGFNYCEYEIYDISK